MPSILIYTRLSTADESDATGRQESACRALAAARDWEVVGVVSDTSASAYNPRAKRPGFEALFQEAESRTCDGVLVWKFDRLVRRPSDFERLWEVVERSGVFLASVTEPLDTSSPLGVAMLRILVALAGLESATTGVRVAATKRRAAERGDPPSQKAYGLTPKWDALVPEESAVIREAATRAIAGERLAHIARDFRERGIASPRGHAFTDSYLGRLLRMPRLAGDRTYRGEVTLRDCYPAVLDRATFDRLQLVLALPERIGAPKRNPRRLATGFAECGLCGHTLATTTRGGVRYYSCPHEPTGCGRLHVIAEPLEQWLLDQLADHLGSHPRAPHHRAPTVGSDELSIALRDLCQDFYVRRIITRDEFLGTRSELTRRLEHQEFGPREVRVRSILAAPDTRAALGRWESARLRALLGERLRRVVVGPRAATRRGVFDAGRLRVEWISG